MQELDIKEIWRTQELSTPELEEHQLERMIRGKSQSIMDSLKKFTRIEHIGNIIVSIAMICYFLYRGDYGFSFALVVFLGATVIYYKRLYNKLYRIQPSADVHDYLLVVHSELRDFVRKYQISFSLLFTVAFGLGLYLGIRENPNADRFGDPIFYVKIASVYLVSLLLCFLLVHVIYASKLRKIKQLLNQLDQLN
ncbi:MAG TPA: hypothetical protein PKJ63_11435 [Cyclobacteriaceae bacterium]|nr:hypothetical protein [Cyclobacteriaceae bacterium]